MEAAEEEILLVLDPRPSGSRVWWRGGGSGSFDLFVVRARLGLWSGWGGGEGWGGQARILVSIYIMDYE